ncbi:MAG: hypothetical protein K1X94_12130 [Sandaracinaceae bacterium]|nr:hypothetical protein [Sandaracinaceae bacterium]
MTLAARYGETEATLVRFAGETLTFEGARALAPGTPVVLVTTRDDGTSLSIEGRALGSRKPTAEAPRFVIQARLVNLTKLDRLWLTARLG